MRLLSHLAIPAFAVVLGIASTGFAESAGQYADDASITAKIKAAIATDTVLKNTDIDVTTDHGVVDVGGTIRSKEEKAEIVRLAKHVDGVKNVKDKTEVHAMNGAV